MYTHAHIHTHLHAYTHTQTHAHRHIHRRTCYAKTFTRKCAYTGTEEESDGPAVVPNFFRPRAILSQGDGTAEDAARLLRCAPG